MLKKIYSITVLAISLGLAHVNFAQLDYTMVPSTPGYTVLNGGTPIGDLAAGSDQTISSPISIGFNFEFDGTTYTEVQASDNGYLHFGNELTPTGYGNASGDLVIPNDFTDATASTPGINTTRPFAAPLWEELAIAGIGGGGNTNYLTDGNTPNRTFTIEWNQVSWRAPTGTNQISFQVVLHETTNIIDFIYMEGPVALGNLPTASIGLAGITNGDFYSLSDSGPNPTVSKTVNTTTINTKPATGQMYSWIPSITTSVKNNTLPTTLSSVFFDANSYLNVSGNFAETGDYEFEVTDLLGRSLYKDKINVTTKGKTNLKFAIPSFATGIYIAKINRKQASEQLKFIKE